MMYESRDANPYYQSADLDFDAARAEWERQGEPPGDPPERADTPTFTRGDLVVRRSYRYTTVGTVVAVSGSRVRVHWPAMGNRTWLAASGLVAATPALLDERKREVAEARAARRLTCVHRWGARADESLYCSDCRSVWDESMGERPRVRPYHTSVAEWEAQR